MNKMQKFKKCPQCGRLYKDADIFYCYNDNHHLIDYETNNPMTEQLKTLNRPTYNSITDYPKKRIEKDSEQCVPKCPTCSSNRVFRVSTLKKATHFSLFGIFSKTAFTQFQCENCGYKW